MTLRITTQQAYIVHNAKLLADRWHILEKSAECMPEGLTGNPCKVQQPQEAGMSEQSINLSHI